jgi:hypothetical protein
MPLPDEGAPPDELLRDETGARSAGRLFLALWLVNDAAYLWVCVMRTLPPDASVLTFLTSVTLALITWVAGPRVAQYLGPQIAGAARAVGDAAKRVLEGRRDGVDPSVPRPAKSPTEQP